MISDSDLGSDDDVDSKDGDDVDDRKPRRKRLRQDKPGADDMLLLEDSDVYEPDGVDADDDDDDDDDDIDEEGVDDIVYGFNLPGDSDSLQPKLVDQVSPAVHS